MTVRAKALLTWLCFAGLSPTHGARADSPMALAPSYLEARQRAGERTAAQLEQTLRGMRDVVAARVHIGQPDVSHALLDQPLPAARVSAWLKVTGPGPDDKTVRSVLASALPEVAPASIYITRQMAAPAATSAIRLSNVGPFRVAAESAPWLRALLALLLATNVGLCTLVLVRRRRSER